MQTSTLYKPNQEEDTFWAQNTFRNAFVKFLLISFIFFTEVNYHFPILRQPLRETQTALIERRPSQQFAQKII